MDSITCYCRVGLYVLNRHGNWVLMCLDGISTQVDLRATSIALQWHFSQCSRFTITNILT